MTNSLLKGGIQYTKGELTMIALNDQVLVAGLAKFTHPLGELRGIESLILLNLRRRDVLFVLGLLDHFVAVSREKSVLFNVFDHLRQNLVANEGEIRGR